MKSKSEKALNFLVGEVLNRRPDADPVRVRELMIKELTWNPECDKVYILMERSVDWYQAHYGMSYKGWFE